MRRGNSEVLGITLLADFTYNFLTRVFSSQLNIA